MWSVRVRVAAAARALASCALRPRSGLAAGVLKSLVPVAVVLLFSAASSPPSACAKPFTFRFPSGFSLASLVGSSSGGGDRSDMEKRDLGSGVAGLKPYSARRVSNESLLMIYWHDQAVAVTELGEEKLLLNCELIEVYDDDDRKKLLKQLSVINRPLKITFPQMVKLMSQCQQVEGVERLEGGGGVAWGAEGEGAAATEAQARARLDAGGARAGLLGGSPLSLLQGIIPGTKWCGTGDIAADYHDLGQDRRMDRCCRTHDLCPTKVRAFSKRYNLTNNSLYSKSHCRCDDMLFDCLKATNTSAAQVMGNIYFNLVQVPCLEESASGRMFRDAKQGF